MHRSGEKVQGKVNEERARAWTGLTWLTITNGGNTSPFSVSCGTCECSSQISLILQCTGQISEATSATWLRPTLNTQATLHLNLNWLYEAKGKFSSPDQFLTAAVV
jgi:hypothetical protein